MHRSATHDQPYLCHEETEQESRTCYPVRRRRGLDGMRAGDRLTLACFSIEKNRRGPSCKDPAGRGVPKPLPRQFRHLSETAGEPRGGVERETRCLTRNL